MSAQEGRREGMANCITGIRIVCSMALLCCLPFSPAFYALYLMAGATDVLDGAVARATHTVSELGSRLDTMADFAFLAVCLVKLLPVLPVERWMVGWTAGIAVIKAINLISGYAMRRRFVAVHSWMNRATGVLLFALPLTLQWVDIRCGAAAVGAVATLAAIQEGHFIRTGKA